MKERHILFNAQMVRAILEGRKTQTRRVVRKQFAQDAEPAEVPATSPEGWQISGHSGLWWDDAGACIDDAIGCPFGKPGDRLWVREAWAYHPDFPESTHRAVFRADPGVEYDVPRWRPSIHMPRWASRILLEVTAVRVERLQDISEADARSEGIADGGCLSCGNSEPCGCADPKPDARDSFCRLWQSINGEQSWHVNPWVWVVEFKRLEGGAA